MFASMFKSMFNKSKNKTEIQKIKLKQEICKQDVEDMLTELGEFHESTDIDGDQSASKDSVIEEAMDLLSITDICSEYLIVNESTNNFDDSKSEVSSIEENVKDSAEVEDPEMKKMMNKVNNLQCLFTWNLKPNKKHNFILYIQNKYGEYNLDITSPEFTFERFIGNLVIGYELFHKGDTDTAQLKVLEIGKWLEDLDNSSDEFYLSISSGIKHVMKATFIHMLFATNLIGEVKWLMDDIVLMSAMDPKSRAAVHGVRAAVLIEYGGNAQYLKKACEYAKKSCETDPNNSYWFYIYSLALTSQRKFLQSYKSNPTENEKNAIQQAILLSNGKNPIFKYHEMLLNRDTIFQNFHKNKNDKSIIATNLKENKAIVKTIISIINMEPKDPHLIVKCARTLMTLPILVRDFNLGKQYLTKAFKMAPNDVTVLKAIENAVTAFKDISKKNKHTTAETKQNKTSILGKELGHIVRKQKQGEDPIPYLNDLVKKYNGYDKTKIMAQICSYTILFTSDLKTGVEQFMKLIEQPGIVSQTLITNHYSSFGSKKFNLAELVYNEIRLATNSSSASSEDMLFYFKTLSTIMEKCKLNIKDVDSSMKVKLIVDSSAKSTCSNTTYQSEIDSIDNESMVDKSEHLKQKTKYRKPKHLQNTGPKIFTNKPEVNKGSIKKSENPRKNPHSKNDDIKNIPNKTYNANTNDQEQMKFKISKFLNSNPTDGHGFSNNSNPLTTENLRNLQTQAQIENYTQQLYQKILSNTQQQYNLHNVSSDGLNRYFNQNHANLNSLLQQSPLQNPYPPPLLSLRPQINQQNPKPPKQSSKKFPPKKK